LEAFDITEANFIIAITVVVSLEIPIIIITITRNASVVITRIVDD
jgi:hypothetical protein